MKDARSGQFVAVAPYYDHLMRFVPYGMWVDYCEQILTRERGEARDVLDLCCGTGSIGLRFAERGYRVVGVDLSPQMVALGRATAEARGSSMRFVVADARKLCLRPEFDVAVCLFDSLNYITAEEQLRECFAGVAAALRRRGLFLFDVNTVRALRLDLFTQVNRDAADSLQYDWRSSWDPASRICTVHMRFRYDDNGRTEEFEEVHHQKGYELDELQRWLKDAGFDCCHVYNAYTLRRAGIFANRVFFVARKARSVL